MAKQGTKNRTAESKKPRKDIKQPAGGDRTSVRLEMEQTLRDIQRALQDREFDSTEEANAFLSGLAGSDIAKVKEALKGEPLSPKEQAQELAWRAMEARTPKEAISVAQQALAKDPDCVDALVVVAEVKARSPKDLIKGLQKAVAAGERSLGAQYFAENKGHFWGLIETRPYMRARHQLAGALLGAGRSPEAIRHFEALLDLNPNDNQGVRDALLGSYLAVDDLDGARRLLRAYAEDASAVFAWSQTLERFLAGDLKGAERALKRARRDNPFVELFLAGKRDLPQELPDSYALGSEEEALICLGSIGEAWAAHVEALAWLMVHLGMAKSQEEAPTEKERQPRLF